MKAGEKLDPWGKSCAKAQLRREGGLRTDNQRRGSAKIVENGKMPCRPELRFLLSAPWLGTEMANGKTELGQGLCR